MNYWEGKMTKTTNFEISKKLAEIGFKRNSTIGWFTSKCGGGGRFYLLEGIEDGYTLECYSFDLETLLDALPEAIRNNEELNLKKNEIGYFFWDSDEIFCSIGAHKQENESLADTAGRLIILLESKNLISFKNA